MDIEHPQIREIERTGYPDHEYLDYERDQERDDDSSEMDD